MPIAGIDCPAMVSVADRSCALTSTTCGKCSTACSNSGGIVPKLEPAAASQFQP